MRPLKGQTLLIIGLGHTGQAITARARAFGMHVLGTRATPQPMVNVDIIGAPDDLPDLLHQADFIVVCTPLTPRTSGLIGAAEIAKMNQGAVLDVFEVEPLLEGRPFWQMENVLISPHCSAFHTGWNKASFDLFLDNLGLWTEGKPLFNIVDPQRGY